MASADQVGDIDQNPKHYRSWRFHDLRHTYASAPVDGGVSPAVLARMMSHASADVSMRVYVGVWDGAESGVRAALASINGIESRARSA